MFDINNIQYNQYTGQYTCCCQMNSPDEAKNLVASYIRISRMVPAGEMFQHGSAAYIGAGSADDVRKVAGAINANYFLWQQSKRLTKSVVCWI